MRVQALEPRLTAEWGGYSWVVYREGTSEYLRAFVASYAAHFRRGSARSLEEALARRFPWVAEALVWPDGKPFWTGPSFFPCLGAQAHALDRRFPDVVHGPGRECDLLPQQSRGLACFPAAGAESRSRAEAVVGGPQGKQEPLGVPPAQQEKRLTDCLLAIQVGRFLEFYGPRAEDAARVARLSYLVEAARQAGIPRIFVVTEARQAGAGHRVAASRRGGDARTASAGGGTRRKDPRVGLPASLGPACGRRRDNLGPVLPRVAALVGRFLRGEQDQRPAVERGSS